MKALQDRCITQEGVIHTEEQIPKDNGVVIAQPVPEGHVAISVPSVEDPSTQDA